MLLILPVQFKNAVAAESSAASSRSSSPSSSSTSMSFSQTVQQQNTIQALHQEQLARLASITLPKLASYHSQRFLNLARAQVQGADTMWSTQKLEAVTYRKALWAEDIEPIADATAHGEGAAAKQRKKKQDGRIVPDFYHRHNPRCTRCALPLVAGLNQVSAMGKPVSSRGRKKAHGKSRKRKAVCTLCHHKTR